MALPTIPAVGPLPPAPNSADPINFDPVGDAFLGHFPALRDQINNAGGAMNAVALLMQAMEAAAAASALAAQTAAGTSLGATAFKGLWSSLAGALPGPASVWDQGQYWVLLQPLADVAAVRPGTDPTKWAPLIAGVAPSVEITADTIAQPGLRYLLCASGITLTLPALMVRGDYFGFVDMVGDRSCKVDFNGHRWRGRAVAVAQFDVPFAGGGGIFEDESKGLV